MPWRDLPDAMGRARQPTIASTVVSGGIWKRIFDALASKSRNGLYLIDSTIVKAHRAASGAKGTK
jgi:transposase